MKLSVIIVTRNRAESLMSCLDSLINQSKTPDEIIIVDNHSKDNTKIIVNDCKGILPVKYLFEPRVGIPIARNTGIKNAKYDIIAFIDDDCIAEKNWIENIIKTHKKHKNILVLQGKTCNQIKRNILCESFQYILDDFDNPFLDSKNFSFKRRLINNLNYVFNKQFKVCEDIELSIRIKQKKIKIMFSEKIITYHNHRQSFISFSRQQFISGIYAYLLKKKFKKQKQDLPKDLQKMQFMIGSLLIMPFIHTAKIIRESGSISSIKYLPFIFSQKLFRYLGFFFGKIYFLIFSN